MADLTLRLLGRPQVSLNSEVGYRTLRRKYVAQGSRLNFEELDKYGNPLFLEVGTEDDEFKGFYLINQTIQPADSGTLEKGYLVREYAEVKKKWLTESLQTSGPLKVLSRKYVVLKAVHEMGYNVQEFARHPESYGNGLEQDNPYAYLPRIIQQSEPDYVDGDYPILCGTSLTYSWVRQSVSVNTTQKGVDVWQISWVEPIRPKGRPAFSLDKKTGLEVLKRQWHLPSSEADNFETQVIHDCLKIGSEDETYPSYVLTDYSVVPNPTIDTVSTLTLSYTKLKAEEFSQSYRQTNDIIHLRKRYAVVRGDNSTYGYGSNWSLHPDNPNRTAPVPSNPWDYAPSWITQAPIAPTLDFSSASSSGFTNTPGVLTGVDDTGVETSLTLQSYLQGASLNSEWLKGSAQVSKGSGGLDVWTVEWVLPGLPYWVLGTSSTKGSASNSVNILEFDHNGIKQTMVGGEASGSSLVKAKTYVFFVVGTDIPESLAEISGGSYSGSRSSSVHFNLWITLADEDGKENGTVPINAMFKNAVWKSSTGATIEFPVQNMPFQGSANMSGTHKVGDKNPYEIVFDFDMHRDLGSYNSNKQFIYDPRGLPLYQGQPVARMGGRISYTATSRIGTLGSSSNFASTTTQIQPLFSSGSKKIWKVAITYVGE